MRKSEIKIDELKLRDSFAKARSVSKRDLRIFFFHNYQSETEQAFRRFLYALQKQQIVLPIGAGIYAFYEKASRPAGAKKPFSPSWSQELEQINETLKKAFPYAQYLIWETRLLHEFTTHQPHQNIVIIQPEKDTSESVFDHLSFLYPGKVFLEPTYEMMTRYVLRQQNCIIISRLITQSPKIISHEFPFPKLEKILVDVLVDKDVFYFFQGEGLVQIFENAIATYWINEKTLMRYAGRRGASSMVRHFLQEEIRVNL